MPQRIQVWFSWLIAAILELFESAQKYTISFQDSLLGQWSSQLLQIFSSLLVHFETENHVR